MLVAKHESLVTQVEKLSNVEHQTLGADPYLPSRQIESFSTIYSDDTQWVNWELIQNLPTTLINL